eukprot:CAMPEP_0184027886 /NCGR_PEP_ID=MMETSP0954-20121128/14469_1 /TAXON_ID=627963 /ORGANISM="Aplanochytrium sp, Strain PBS07" /LENGTH=146 /DNA_ID=CAMNT_0026312539 /DNA_START=286 /DNA_END=726 /DNA_ORIENTATION=+
MNNKNGFENIRYEVLDVTNGFPYKDASYDVCIDKSTMDTILHNTTEGEQKVAKMISEISRILRYNGFYLLLTQMDFEKEADYEFFVNVVLSTLQSSSELAHWKLTVHSSAEYPLHVYVFEKLKCHEMSRRSGEKSPVVILKSLNYD